MIKYPINKIGVDISYELIMIIEVALRICI